MPTSRSTSPTLINCRRKSSSRKVSSAKSMNLSESLILKRRQVPSQSFKSGGGETKKIGKGLKSTDRANRRYAETGSCRTFLWEYDLCTRADSTRRLARNSTDCSPPALSPRPSDARRQARGDLWD